MVCVFLGNLRQMLVPNPQQLLLRVLARMLDVDALFMPPAAAHFEFNSSYSRRLHAAGYDESLMLHCVCHCVYLHGLKSSDL